MGSADGHACVRVCVCEEMLPRAQAGILRMVLPSGDEAKSWDHLSQLMEWLGDKQTASGRSACWRGPLG